MNEEKRQDRRNQTFSRRIGKSLSKLKKDLLKNELPKYLYAPESIELPKNQKIFLEIGFGMGEHLVNQLSLNSEDLFIGAEVYLNGVANILKLVKERQINNLMIWPDDIDIAFKIMPPTSLDGIYLLFPDPWHKRRYLKKRLFNQERLDEFKTKLKPGGFIIMGSDIPDYFKTCLDLLSRDSDFVIEETNFLQPHTGYMCTKYHQKAIREGRTAQFLKARLS